LASVFRRTVRGMRDLLPEEAETLKAIEHLARNTAHTFGYREVITPIVEHYELLAAKIGEETRERMYVFKDLGGRKVALRPEFTASIARLVATKMVSQPRPIRLFCTGSLYRYDEPQFGRYREFWQANYELIGAARPEADAEVIALTNEFLEGIELRGYHFKVGHVGILRGILEEEGIKEAEQNSVMQLLDKKDWDAALNLVGNLGASSRCRETLRELFETHGKEPAQVIGDILNIVKDYKLACQAAENLHDIINLLSESRREIDLLIEARFARGLEYYTGIIFEVYAPSIDVALAGGGRYDRLIELFGGEHTPAVGVALGIDRIMLGLTEKGMSKRTLVEKRVLVVPLVDELKAKGFEVSSKIREAGGCAEVEVMGRSVTKTLSDADRRGITHVIIIGPKEWEQKKVVLRDMRRKEQKSLNVEEVLNELAAKHTSTPS